MNRDAALRQALVVKELFHHQIGMPVFLARVPIDEYKYDMYQPHPPKDSSFLNPNVKKAWEELVKEGEVD